MNLKKVNMQDFERINRVTVLFPRVCGLFLLFFSVNQVSSQGFVKYSNEFLNIGVGARALGMSGAQTPMSQDVPSGYWTPEGLALMADTTQAEIMRSESFAGC